MQGTGIKHKGPHSHIPAKQESSNTSSTLSAMKRGSEEKEKKKKAPHSHLLTSPSSPCGGMGRESEG